MKTEIMTMGIAADHGGFHLKEEIKRRQSEYAFKDLGAHSYDADDDYPYLICPLTHALAVGEIDRGIALRQRCGCLYGS